MRRDHSIPIGAVFGLALLSATMAAHAEFSDPTRPAVVVDAQVSPGMQLGAQTGLQTIIHRESAKPGAIINGEYVVLGGQVGDARLIEVGDDFVTLKGPSGTETLQLSPGVERTPVRDEPRRVERRSTGKRATRGKEIK